MVVVALVNCSYEWMMDLVILVAIVVWGRLVGGYAPVGIG